MKKSIVFLFFLMIASLFVCAPLFADPAPTNGPYDGNTGSMMTASWEHRTIHDGKHFFYQDSITLASAASQSYLIQTPNNGDLAHMTFVLDGTAITHFFLYETSDYVGSDTVTAFNNNRMSSNLPGLSIYKDAVASGSIGTLIKQYKSGTAGGVSRTQSHTRSDDEVMLKSNTKYLLRAYSGTADNLVNVKFLWYEHESLKNQ